MSGLSEVAKNSCEADIVVRLAVRAPDGKDA